MEVLGTAPEHEDVGHKEFPSSDPALGLLAVHAAGRDVVLLQPRGLLQLCSTAECAAPCL